MLGMCQTACKQAPQSALDSSSVIAERIELPTGDLIALNVSHLVSDTVDFPLSTLVENLEIAILDPEEEALVGGGRVTLSDHFILISNSEEVPYKLFDRSGKYIRSIGSYGQGPDEYLNTYHEQLDEKHGRIYILPWMSEKLLVFDLEGNPQPAIPLHVRVGKGKFRVDGDKKEVTVTTLPFEGMQEFVWVQDFQGNRKQVLKPGHLTAPRDFSNEVYNQFNLAAYDVNLCLIMPTRKDTLYHYNVQANQLEPRFTVRFEEEEVPWHGYLDLPHHYLGDISFPVQVGESTWSGSKPSVFIIDKQTLQSSFIRLYNDFLGLKDVWHSFQGGYYVANYDPMTLKEALQTALQQDDLPEAVRQRVTQLSDALHEDSNNVIVWGKLKN